jgi:fucose permease
MPLSEIKKKSAKTFHTAVKIRTIANGGKHLKKAETMKTSLVINEWCYSMLHVFLIANSLVWAGIWPLALDGLGKSTRLGASIMIMGLCGNAIVALFYGWLADRFDTRQAYWVLFPCYLCLKFYAVYGHRVRNWRRLKR